MVPHVSLALAFVSIAAAQTSPASRDQHETGRPPAIGSVHFETSCDAAVREDFDRAVALLHSFWFRASAETFTDVGERDPKCGMAWWGVAMSRWGNPFAGQRPAVALEQGAAAVKKAQAVSAKTPREAAYIAAVAELYKDYETVPQRTRVLNYERGMQKVADGSPDDREAAAFYALAINQTALPTDKTYAQQLKAAAILEDLFKVQPDHPGVAHYLIHAYDHPPLAERALPAARRYAKIAPDAPHALHMPSHTFTRVGHWEESIEANRASAAAARNAGSPGEVLHALDYQVYAYLQTAQDQAARDVLAGLAEIEASLDPDQQYNQAGQFALAAIPARVALERGAWAEAARLQPRSSPFPYADALVHFARAVGAARAGQPQAAAADVQKLGELHAALVQKGEDYWAEQVLIQQTSARGWVAFAEGRKDEAVSLLRDAARREDGTDKSAVSPGPIAPARELLGEMLLELNRGQDALLELEAVIAKEPNRFRATLNAARAAMLSNDAEKAWRYYRDVTRVAEKGDTPGRSELQEAREAVQRRSKLPLR